VSFTAFLTLPLFMLFQQFSEYIFEIFVTYLELLFTRQIGWPGPPEHAYVVTDRVIMASQIVNWVSYDNANSTQT
jgi:hypothetical protein